MFGVFIHRQDSKYNDHPSKQYQFPKNYLSRALQFEGGWVLFYEPTKVKNSRGYYATAKIDKIVSDPSADNMYLALLEPESYFEFPNSVALRHKGQLLERGLYNESGGVSGRAQAAVRPISKTDFNRILDKGLEDTVSILPRQDIDHTLTLSVQEGQVDFQHTQIRRREAYRGNRIVRSSIFRRLVINAYDERCAFTGLKFINGGGRAEVEAAHIRPVEHSGPDSIQNGLALSGTVHWMFDRGLLGLDDNMEIMVSRHINDRDSLEKLIQPSFIATTPEDIRFRPHPAFLKWHRDNCFKT